MTTTEVNRQYYIYRLRETLKHLSKDKTFLKKIDTEGDGLDNVSSPSEAVDILLSAVDSAYFNKEVDK